MINRFLQQLPDLVRILLSWPFIIQVAIVLILPLLGAWHKRLFASRLESVRKTVSG